MKKAFQWGAWSILGMLTFAGSTLATTEENDSDAFLMRLSEFHQYQQKLNSLSEQQAESAEFGELAESIAVDHQILDEWLQEAGHDDRQRGDDSAYIDDEQQQAYEALKSREGVDFDHHFLEYQVNFHRQALNFLQEITHESLEGAEQANHLKVT